MKISKWVTFEQEVEIDVSAEDIQGILAETPENEDVVTRIISRFHSFMTHTNEDILMKINNDKRKIIRDFLLNQADRFLPTENNHARE